MQLFYGLKGIVILVVLLVSLLVLATSLNRPVVYYKVGTDPVEGCLRVAGSDPKNGKPLSKCESLSALEKSIARKVAVEK